MVLRLYFWHHTPTKLSLLVLAGAFGLVLVWVISKGSPPTLFELIWLLLPPLFVLFIFLIQPSRISRQAVQNEQLITEATWEVKASGVQISSCFGSTLLEWGCFEKLLITGEYYLLLSKTKKNSFRFLPRRAFTSAQEETEFLGLVDEHILNG